MIHSQSHMNSLQHSPNLRTLHLPPWQAPASLSRVAAVAQQGLSHPNAMARGRWQTYRKLGLHLWKGGVEPVEPIQKVDKWDLSCRNWDLSSRQVEQWELNGVEQVDATGEQFHAFSKHEYV